MSPAGSKKKAVSSRTRTPAADEYESGSRIVRHIPAATLGEYACERLGMLCQAAGFEKSVDSIVGTFRRLISPWAYSPGVPGWTSDISDDHTPIEFSVTIADGRSEIRALFEAQGTEPTLRSYREAGLALHDRLEREFGADLARFRIVRDLFLPENMEGPFAVWNSVVFSPDRAPMFKTYFNPHARGRAKAYALVEEALERLGVHRAWASLCRAAARRGPHLDEVKYLALDLAADDQARVKVYVRHHGATPDDLEVASSMAEGYVPGEALHFARAMGGERSCLSARAPFTCSAFVEGRDERPAATTLYVPVCAYAPDDAAVTQRVNDYLVSQHIDEKLYDRIVQGFANRPLNAGVGMQSWVALRRYDGSARLTVYLATEAARVFPPGTVPAATGDRTAYASAERVVRCAATYDLRDHPFIRRLFREPNGDRLLWLLVKNLYEGTSKHAVNWSAALTARVQDNEIRSLLALKLNQELGEGDASKAHFALMTELLKCIEPLRPSDFTDAWLESGRSLGRRIAPYFVSADPPEGIGALMISDVCAEQVVSLVIELLRALPDKFDPTLLARVANEHSGQTIEESCKLARLVRTDPASIEAVRRGVAGVHHACWQSLDELFVACFGALQVS